MLRLSNKCGRQTLGRAPSNKELTLALDHWTKSSTSEATNQPAALTMPLSVQRAAVEENTGERFTYTETLYSNRDYVPDVQWSDVDARTRGLAHLCLVLLNSNEFLYVY